MLSLFLSTCSLVLENCWSFYCLHGFFFFFSITFFFLLIYNTDRKIINPRTWGMFTLPYTCVITLRSRCGAFPSSQTVLSRPSESMAPPENNKYSVFYCHGVVLSVPELHIIGIKQYIYFAIWFLLYIAPCWFFKIIFLLR